MRPKIQETDSNIKNDQNYHNICYIWSKLKLFKIMLVIFYTGNGYVDFWSQNLINYNTWDDFIDFDIDLTYR